MTQKQTDYQCNCTFDGGAHFRYTIMDAARRNMFCQRCNSPIVPAPSAPVALEEDDIPSGDVNSEDPLQRALGREAEILRRRNTKAGDIGVTTAAQARRERENEEQRKQIIEKIVADDKLNQDAERLAGLSSRDIYESRNPEIVEDMRAEIEDFKKHTLERYEIPGEDNLEDIRKLFRESEKRGNWRPFIETPAGLRIRYAHGVVYEFEWYKFDDSPRMVEDKLLAWVESWEKRRNATLVLHYDRRTYILNAELVAGIDYKL